MWAYPPATRSKQGMHSAVRGGACAPRVTPKVASACGTPYTWGRLVARLVSTAVLADPTARVGHAAGQVRRPNRQHLSVVLQLLAAPGALPEGVSGGGEQAEEAEATATGMHSCVRESCRTNRTAPPWTAQGGSVGLWGASASGGRRPAGDARLTGGTQQCSAALQFRIGTVLARAGNQGQVVCWHWVGAGRPVDPAVRVPVCGVDRGAAPRLSAVGAQPTGIQRLLWWHCCGAVAGWRRSATTEACTPSW